MRLTKKTRLWFTLPETIDPSPENERGRVMVQNFNAVDQQECAARATKAIVNEKGQVERHLDEFMIRLVIAEKRIVAWENMQDSEGVPLACSQQHKHAYAREENFFEFLAMCSKCVDDYHSNQLEETEKNFMRSHGALPEKDDITQKDAKGTGGAGKQSATS